MPESVPLTYQTIKRRAPEPLEEAVEKCVRDVLDYALRGYCDMSGVTVTRADTGDDLIAPAVIIRAARLRESIPAGDVYEVEVAVSMMTLMDTDTDISAATPQEFTDNLWAAIVAIAEDPDMLAILQDSRSSCTWHGLVRRGGMAVARQDRHALRTYTFAVHVSRLV